MIKYFFNTALIILLLALFPLVMPAQCLNWVSLSDTIKVHDFSTNDGNLWADPAFNDPLQQGPTNLAEATIPEFVLQNTCGGSLTFSYVLLLDLDGDGTQETALTNTNQPASGKLLVNNAANPGYIGTETATFDNRPVDANQKYRFALQSIMNNDSTYSISIKWDNILQPGIFTDAQLPYGNHQIMLTATNGSVSSSNIYNIQITDNKEPTVVCINGLSASMVPTGSIQIWASDFLQYTEDNYSPTPFIVIGVRKSGTGTGFPLNQNGSPQNFVVFECIDLGIQLVELWAKDQYGNANYCEVPVEIVNKNYACDPLLAMKYIPAFTCADEDVLWPDVLGAKLPLVYLWNTGATTPNLTFLVDGIYTVTVTDANNKTVTGSYTVVGAPTGCALVKGVVAKDTDGTCLLSPASNPLGGFIVQFEDGQNNKFYTTSNPDGTYRKRLTAGIYTVSNLLPNDLWAGCQSSYSLNCIANQTLLLDLPLVANYNCAAINVNFSTPSLRSCFDNTYYTNYCNGGTEVAIDAYIDIEFDSYLTVLGAGIPYTALGNNTFRFAIGNVPIGGCGSFGVDVFLDCGSVAGQTHCAKATAYPPGDCLPVNILWSGASIELAASCENDSLRFTITNVGTGDMTESVEYIVIEDLVMVHQGNVGPLAAGQSMNVLVPYNGSTWRMEVDQVAYHPGASKPSVAIESCNGTVFQTGLINVFTQNEGDTWVDIDCKENSNSFLVNQKIAFPTGYGAEHFIEAESYIYYEINFLNTTADSVNTVVIRDTLSEWFDLSTFSIGASNFPYTFEFEGTGSNIKITFTDLHLPPVNNPNVNSTIGFVGYYVKLRSDVPLGTDVLNTAYLNLGDDDRIVTNTVQHRVGDDFVQKATSSVSTLPNIGVDLVISPNPSSGTLTILTQKASLNKKSNIVVTDISGKRVALVAANDNGKYQINCTSWANGVYWVQYWVDGQIEKIVKFVKI